MVARTQTRHSLSLRAVHSVLLLTALWLPGALAAVDDGVAKRGPSPSDSSPQPPQPIYLFDGPVVKEMSFDGNKDGLPERRETYERGALVLVELDQNSDGVVDVRLKYDASPCRLWVQEVDGAHRFVPFVLSPHCATAWTWRGLVSAERLVDGQWTGTFAYTESERVGEGPDDGPVTLAAVWTFEDGKVVREVLTGGWGPRYQRIEFAHGMPETSFIGDSADRIWKRITWEDGKAWREEEDLDRDGTMDIRRESDMDAPHRVRIEKVIDGVWTGAFDETRRTTWNGHDYMSVTRYDEGYPTRTVVRLGDEGPVAGGETYRDGYKVASEHDRDGDGTIDMKCRYKESDPYFPVETLKLENGRWTGDFVVETEGTRTAYVNGRMARLDQGGDRDGDGEYDSFTVYVSDLEWDSGTNGRIDTWTHYSEKRQPVREERDLDGDGKPDLFIDYVNLTIEHRLSKPAEDTAPGS